MTDGTRNGKRILALNSGSSSLKFGLYDARDSVAPVCEGEAESIGSGQGSFWLRRGEHGEKKEERVALPDQAAALGRALEVIKLFGGAPDAVGHRFVHGGPAIREHSRVTPEVLAKLQSAVEYAPLHLPASLAAVEAIERDLPGIPQVICLDTAFHASMPDVARTFALPVGVRARGVERFGFHGLSVESIVAQLDPVPERLVVAHLGNGSSVTAVRSSKSIDTTMGLTPTGGVMMGTRCGDIDPGALIYLMRNGYASADQMEELVDKRSGLLGISERTSSVRELIETRKEDAKVDLALRMFSYQVSKMIAAMTVALGGLDLLVLTGGIGEHASEMRDEICAALSCLPKHEVKVLPAREELQIVRITAGILGSS